jgi:hypothetical protein
MGDTVKDIGVAFATVGIGTVVDKGFLAPARRAGRAAEDASRDRREARAVSTASSENERQVAIKSQLRQERVRRAQLEVAAEATGTADASSVTGQASANKATTAAGQAFATGKSFSNTAQSELLQSAADADFRGQKATAKGQLWQSGVDLGFKAFSAFAGG